MRLGWLQLRDFRCYRALEFEPDPGVNLLVGENGSGKSAVLEAIGYLVSLTSFRRAVDAALILGEEAAAVVRGRFTDQDTSMLVETEIPVRGPRRVLVDGKRAQGRTEVASRLALVAFLPDDLDLVKRGPALRREFLDDLAVQLWPVAGAEQQDFERALRQRNTLLRQDGPRADGLTLDVWDERLADLGSVVVVRRLQAAARLIPLVAALCRSLGTGDEEIEWRYQAAGLGDLEASATTDEVRSRLAAGLAAARQEDMERRMTTLGPHRDEMLLLLDGRDLRTRASQGEQRTAALAMRLGSFDLISSQRHAAPILILDDVFSELDAQRRQRLVERFPRSQVFVSTARQEDVPVHGARWVVAGGSVRREGTA